MINFQAAGSPFKDCWRKGAFLCLLMSASSVFSGCGRGSGRLETIPVAGAVTLDGRPVPQGSVLFIPAVPGPTGQANLRPDGTFQAGTYGAEDGLVAGDYAVTIVGQMSLDSATTSQLLPEQAESTPGIEYLPRKYGDHKSSGLKASVKKGQSNQLIFTLIKSEKVRQ